VALVDVRLGGQRGRDYDHHVVGEQRQRGLHAAAAIELEQLSQQFGGGRAQSEGLSPALRR
jgi:hypothetical protein